MLGAFLDAGVSGGDDTFFRCALAYGSGLLLRHIESRVWIGAALGLRDEPLKGGAIHGSLH